VDWSGKVVIVTGASSGIGRQTALDFAKRGARLVISARRAERLQRVSAECQTAGGEVEAMVGDLAEREFAESMVAQALARFGRLDVLVNNAGVPKHKHFYDVTPEDIEYTLRVNFLAPAYLTLAAVPAMLRQGEGYIVNISSGAGKLPPPRETVYAASKYALTGLSEGLALDLAGSNIHVSVIHVGPIDTEIWDRAESPVRYAGRKYSPRLVSEAVFRCIEKRRHELTVPRRLSLFFFLKALMPGAFRWGAARWDPVPRAVIEEAREKARR
jgi:short-subunit dehydrogenase